jgi:hypothetical protein
MKTQLIGRQGSSEGQSDNAERNMIVKETFVWRGKPLLVDAFRVNNHSYVISGSFLRTASLKKRWQEDVENPAEVIQMLKNASLRIDLFRFWQRIPETGPKFGYHKERRDIAVIPVTTFEHWWSQQINTKTRNMVRKSKKLGVTIEEVEFSDELVRGIVGVFSESPVRRGKAFWHYGGDFESVKKAMSADLEEAVFIAAYYEKELIGFTKLLITDRSAMVTLILDKMSHRNKSPMNGMIAKAVEICANRKIPYITYTLWRRGDHGEFQKRNGFQKMPVPEYFVPLTIRGKLALLLGMHKGLKGVLPERVIVWLLALRSKWYAIEFTGKIRSRSGGGKSVTSPAS